MSDTTSSEAEADDGAIQDFWALPPEDIEALAELAGDPDPGADQRDRRDHE